MQEALPDAWYYTRDAARLGPVTRADLQLLAEQGALNPRLDLVWTPGQGAWQPAGEIDGLFAKPTPPPLRDALAPPADRYEPPPLESVEAGMSRIVDWPGARRRSFLFAMILFPWGWYFAVALSAGWLAGQLGPHLVGVIGGAAACVPWLVALYFGLMRLVNLGMSRWWYLANFVPVLNLWVGYRCFACPAGYAFHKKLDGPGICLAIVYWLVVGAAVISVVALVALFFGLLGDPALQEQLREQIRRVNQLTGPR